MQSSGDDDNSVIARIPRDLSKSMYRFGGARACNRVVGVRPHQAGLGDETAMIAWDVEWTPDFEDFYRVQYPRLARVLFGMTGRWTLAEELTQEVLLTSYRRWARVRRLDRPDLWVRRVAINRAVSLHRRLVTEAAVLLRLRTTIEVPPVHVADDQPLWDAVAALPRRQAAALVLSEVDGYTLDEVGQMLGCSAETARTHVRRARERLRIALSEEGT